MRRVSRSALVPYTAREMFVLVDDVEAYPEFLPWCNDTEVHNRTDDTVDATLELHKGSLSNHFTTRNTRREFEAIELELIGGPFRQLQGGWQFTEIGEEGCKVTLELEFEFENKLIDMMFGAFFEDTCNSLVDAFTKRAQVVFGAR
ncbi:MAG: ubiquinone-binding protein [Woeseiaceae bacterium]|nr:ubiquinone-binding protein [Woeseiaceae bacterium]